MSDNVVSLARRLLAAGAAAAGLAGSAFAQAPAGLDTGFRRDHADGYIAIPSPLATEPWRKFYQQMGGDLREALQRSRNGVKRGVLVVFSWNDCPFTQAMRSLVFGLEEIQSYFHSRMEVVYVDAMSPVTLTDFEGRQVGQRRFAEMNQVTSTPTFFFYDTGGRLRYRHHGAIPDAHLFYTFGRLLADGQWDVGEVERQIQVRHGVRRD